MDDPEVELIADGYDAVYQTAGESATLARIWRDHATGPGFPEAFSHISFITVAELTSVAADLALGSGDLLVDLACGAGGPGLWVARDTGAHLVGVDISEVALTRAGERAEAVGLSGRSRFQRGSFAEPGLDPAGAAGAMSVDALQYAPDKAAALAGIARALAPGGRFVFIAFELDAEHVADLPIWSDPVGDYRPVLEAAGFRVERYEETSGWRDRLTATYEAVLAEGETLEAEMGPVAAAALSLEAATTLDEHPYSGRVLVAATRLG